MKGFGLDALLKAWNKQHLGIVRTILEHAALRKPASEYATALELWRMKEKKDFEAWISARSANAPENRPEVVAFRGEIKRREKEMLELNKQRIAVEMGIAPPVTESDVKGDGGEKK